VSVDIHVATDIDASPDAVWSRLQHIDSHIEWMADAETISFRTAQRDGVGTEFECRTKIGPLTTNDVMRVTEWEPAAVMGIEHRGLIRGSGRFTLTPAPHGRTHFAWDERLTFPWWLGGRAGELAAKPVLRRIWKGNLVRLRDQFGARD
jgi:hypothetical protein